MTMISFNKAINIKHSWGSILFIGIVCCLVLEPYRSLFTFIFYFNNLIFLIICMLVK